MYRTLAFAALHLLLWCPPFVFHHLVMIAADMQVQMMNNIGYTFLNYQFVDNTYAAFQLMNLLNWLVYFPMFSNVSKT